MNFSLPTLPVSTRQRLLRDFIIKTGNEDVAFSYDRAV